MSTLTADDLYITEEKDETSCDHSSQLYNVSTKYFTCTNCGLIHYKNGTYYRECTHTAETYLTLTKMHHCKSCGNNRPNRLYNFEQPNKMVYHQTNLCETIRPFSS
jgi:hypothetical protein